jgi:hypothetical protein
MKWLRRLLAFSFATVAFLCFLSFRVMHSACKNDVVQRVASPSGEYVAQVWESYCTVGSDWDTDVTVRERPFILSYLPVGRAAGVLSLYGPASRLRLDWKGNSELVIECRGCKQTELRKLQARWKDVAIHYTVTQSDRRNPESARLKPR